jgi:hypothetical protein
LPGSKLAVQRIQAGGRLGEGNASHMLAAGFSRAVRARSHSTIGFSGSPAAFSFKVLNFLDSPASKFLKEEVPRGLQGE